MSKPKGKIRVRFIGKNATDVTGSCTVIEYCDKKILIECGLYQGGTDLEQYNINKSLFKSGRVKCSEVDYIIAGHCHADHTQLISLAVKEGFCGQILMPCGSKEIYSVMAMDSCNIMGRTAQDLSKRLHREYLPIYEEDDVKRSIELFRELPINERITIDDTLEIRFVPSGHIANACQIELWIKNNGGIKHILYTSDLGNRTVKQYYTEPYQQVMKSNLVIGECTYGESGRTSTKKDRDKDIEKIDSIIKSVCIDKHKKVLIPIFSLHRAQTILTMLWEMYGDKDWFNIPILLDSPLAIKLTEIYRSQFADTTDIEKVLSWKNINFLTEFKDTEYWATNEAPCVFLSASGMMVAGRSKFVASKLLPDRDSHIIFVGFSVENSLASKIKSQKTKSLKIDKKVVPCRCGITDLKSFSSHATYENLIETYTSGNFDKIALVHGNFNTKLNFCQELQEELSKRNKTSRVICVNKDTEILL